VPPHIGFCSAGDIGHVLQHEQLGQQAPPFKRRHSVLANPGIYIYASEGWPEQGSLSMHKSEEVGS